MGRGDSRRVGTNHVAVGFTLITPGELEAGRIIVQRWSSGVKEQRLNVARKATHERRTQTDA